QEHRGRSHGKGGASLLSTAAATAHDYVARGGKILCRCARIHGAARFEPDPVARTASEPPGQECRSAPSGGFYDRRELEDLAMIRLRWLTRQALHGLGWQGVAGLGLAMAACAFCIAV